MLKKRISASLVIRDSIVVQSIGFQKYLPIGNPAIAAEFLCQWGVDEIILIDISATKEKRPISIDIVKEVATKTRVPLTVGGGLKTLEEIDVVMSNGGDRVVLNNICLTKPELITQAADKYGQQCIVASIDALKADTGYLVYDYINKGTTTISPENRAQELEKLGAGEIFLNSVDRDGKYSGYDKSLIQLVCSKISIPLIACGGAKNADDMADLFINTKASAACASNFFHFTEQSVTTAKAVLKKKNIDVRLDTFSTFNETTFDKDLRLIKKDDRILEEMRFIKIEKEII